MGWQEKMENALEYIEQNLDSYIDLNILAMKTLCSPYNFQRMFSFLSDVTLAEYIRYRRLTLAAEELARTNIKVIDVAIKYNYDSPTSFARAFAAYHGVTPMEVKKSNAVYKSYPKLSFQNIGKYNKGDIIMKSNQNGRLILIDGMCGTGKSTTAQKLNEQFSLCSIPHRWMHEEITEHPIRNGEFTKGDLQTPEGMKINVDDMIKSWEALVETIVNSGEIYIMEGCFLQAICRYFSGSVYSIEETLSYFKCVLDILLKANTLFVYLWSPNVKTTLEHLYPIRGTWWKNLILKPEEKYFHMCQYTDEHTAYQTWELYQKISNDVFEMYSGSKLKIDAPVGSWNGHTQKIMFHLELPYLSLPPIIIENPQQYCGVYTKIVNDEKRNIEIRYDSLNDTLYAIGFWPYMKLLPKAINSFEMESFPITLSFNCNNSIKSVQITGEYDWDIVGLTMVME